MELTERPDGGRDLNDAYNANPESMRAALKTLATIGRARTGAARSPSSVRWPSWAADTQAEHEAVGRLAARLGIARLIAVGGDARPIAQAAALEGSWDGEVELGADADAAIGLLNAELRRR